MMVAMNSIGRKSFNLSFDPLKNIRFSGNHNQEMKISAIKWLKTMWNFYLFSRSISNYL